MNQTVLECLEEGLRSCKKDRYQAEGARQAAERTMNDKVAEIAIYDRDIAAFEKQIKLLRRPHEESNKDE